MALAVNPIRATWALDMRLDNAVFDAEEVRRGMRMLSAEQYTAPNVKFERKDVRELTAHALEKLEDQVRYMKYLIEVDERENP